MHLLAERSIFGDGDWGFLTSDECFPIEVTNLSNSSNCAFWLNNSFFTSLFLSLPWSSINTKPENLFLSLVGDWNPLWTLRISCFWRTLYKQNSPVLLTFLKSYVKAKIFSRGQNAALLEQPLLFSTRNRKAYPWNSHFLQHQNSVVIRFCLQPVNAHLRISL